MSLYLQKLVVKQKVLESDKLSCVFGSSKPVQLCRWMPERHLISGFPSSNSAWFFFFPLIFFSWYSQLWQLELGEKVNLQKWKEKKYEMSR